MEHEKNRISQFTNVRNWFRERSLKVQYGKFNNT